MSDISGRFFFTLLVNIVKAILGFSVGLLLAKGLGPVDYGRFSFLLATFLSTISLLDMGTSNAFFTFISKTKQSINFYYYYFTWVLLQLLIGFLLIYAVTPDHILATLFVGEQQNIVLLAFIAAFFQQQLWTLLSHLAEACRQTIKIQRLNLGIALCNFLFVTVLYYTNKLSIENVMAFIIFQYICALFSFWLLIYDKNDLISNKESESLSSIFSKFKVYCAPLMVFVFFSFAYRFLDAWMLQHYGGAKEQAYFAISSKIASISLIFTTSLIRILWKEIADAEQKGDADKVHTLYRQSTRTLYFISAAICGIILPWAEQLIDVLLGEQYQDAVIPFTIMLIYPVHQSLGQINGTMFYAIEQTKTYSKIGVAGMISSVFFTYLLLSNDNKFLPGQDMGSEGLAYKMIFLQVLTVNVGMYFIAKIQKWQYDWFYQVYMLCVTIFSGYIAYTIANYFDYSIYTLFIISGVIYIILIICLVLIFSINFFNINRDILINKIFYRKATK
tara:strand:- start:15202 stop:16710 length:1509 start_codon:yes stop_codon:yes gene_type:complete